MNSSKKIDIRSYHSTGIKSKKSFVKNIPFFLIPVLVFFNFIISLKISNEDITTADEYNYLRLAKEFPYIWDTTFPVFYPVVIKIVNIFCGDYFVASKVVAALSIVFIFIYSYWRDFYWKELWVIFSTVSFIETNFLTRSETLFIPLLLIFSYLSYQFLTNRIRKNKIFILKFSLVLILMCATKYSSIFILAALYFYLLIYFLIRRKILFPILISCAVCTVFFLLYLFHNKYLTGFYTGKRMSTWENRESLNIQLSIFHVFYSFNPFINSRVIFHYKINHFILLFISLSLYIPLIINIIKRTITVKSFQLYFLTIGLIFLMLTLLSYFVTKIDNLNARLLLPFIFFLYIFIAMIVKKKKYMIVISYLSLILSILDNIYILNHGLSL